MNPTRSGVSIVANDLEFDTTGYSLPEHVGGKTKIGAI
jgi:hypothetical protein